MLAAVSRRQPHLPRAPVGRARARAKYEKRARGRRFRENDDNRAREAQPTLRTKPPADSTNTRVYRVRPCPTRTSAAGAAVEPAWAAAPREDASLGVSLEEVQQPAACRSRRRPRAGAPRARGSARPRSSRRRRARCSPAAAPASLPAGECVRHKCSVMHQRVLVALVISRTVYVLRLLAARCRAAFLSLSSALDAAAAAAAACPLLLFCCCAALRRGYRFRFTSGGFYFGRSPASCRLGIAFSRFARRMGFLEGKSRRRGRLQRCTSVHVVFECIT